MSELTFAQPESRNLAVPILVAVLLLGVVGGLVYRAIPHTDAEARITGVVVHPVETVYRKPANIAAEDRDKVHDVTESGLYLIPAVRIEDHLGVPLFLKDFAVSFMTADGEMHRSAVEQGDLPAVYAAFPEIKPLMGVPLLRETSVPAKGAAEGTLLLQFPVSREVWDKRQSATLTIDLYRQPSITVPFPKP